MLRIPSQLVRHITATAFQCCQLYLTFSGQISFSIHVNWRSFVCLPTSFRQPYLYSQENINVFEIKLMYAVLTKNIILLCTVPSLFEDIQSILGRSFVWMYCESCENRYWGRGREACCYWLHVLVACSYWCNRLDGEWVSRLIVQYIDPRR